MSFDCNLTGFCIISKEASGGRSSASSWKKKGRGKAGQENNCKSNLVGFDVAVHNHIDSHI